MILLLVRILCGSQYMNDNEIDGMEVNPINEYVNISCDQMEDSDNEISEMLDKNIGELLKYIDFINNNELDTNEGLSNSEKSSFFEIIAKNTQDLRSYIEGSDNEIIDILNEEEVNLPDKNRYSKKQKIIGWTRLEDETVVELVNRFSSKK